MNLEREKALKFCEKREQLQQHLHCSSAHDDGHHDDDNLGLVKRFIPCTHQ